ncbi:uncharacterized protein LOC122860766 [Aphidius gifuensis]|uniref:uncharacterized protein LOC122860766 n=1 Tax=Aphidius gifuensis TaxID=684658 RepID=UPI001CDC9C78|nr:uncharacterized protein LOC122860766 [Aphidius gifuensis]
MASKWSIIKKIFILFCIIGIIETNMIKKKKYKKNFKNKKLDSIGRRQQASEEIHQESSNEWPVDLVNNNENETMACAMSLVDQQQEVCEIVYQINQLNDLLPHLHDLLLKRLGDRKIVFTIYVNKSSSTVEMLADAGKALFRSIGKFIRFLGYVEKLFNSAIGTTETIDINKSRRSFFSSPNESGFLGEIINTGTVDEDEIQMNIKKAWSRKCSMDLIKLNNNTCDIITRINKLDNLLKNTIMEFINTDSMDIPVQLSSDKLSLNDFFDSYHMALLNAKDNDGRKKFEYNEKFYNGKRVLINNKKEKINEIFQTSDYKIEFIEMKNKKNHKKISMRKNFNRNKINKNIGSLLKKKKNNGKF